MDHFFGCVHNKGEKKCAWGRKPVKCRSASCFPNRSEAETTRGLVPASPYDKAVNMSCQQSSSIASAWWTTWLVFFSRGLYEEMINHSTALAAGVVLTWMFFLCSLQLRFLPALFSVMFENAVACFQMFLTNTDMIITFCISVSSSVKSQYVNGWFLSFID